MEAGWKCIPWGGKSALSANLLCGKRGVYRRGRRCKAGACGKCSLLCCDLAGGKSGGKSELYLCSLWSIFKRLLSGAGRRRRTGRSECSAGYFFLLSQKAAGGGLRGLERNKAAGKHSGSGGKRLCRLCAGTLQQPAGKSQLFAGEI